MNNTRLAPAVVTTIATLLTLVLAPVACTGAASVTPAKIKTDGIINGTSTSNWPAVGALVVDAYGSWEEYCTATLIDPQWILTAAHCVDPNDNQVPHEYVANFFIGANVAGAGHAYVIDAIHAHPDYDPTYIDNDIAVAHLGSAVTGTTPLVYNTSAVGTGNTITWVGYGVSQADGSGGGSGGGTKRTAVGAISQTYTTRYDYDQNNQGQLTCFGDSGGPDLVGGTGSERVAGVHSTVSDNYCASSATSTRVDAYQTWIRNTLAGGGPLACDIAGGDCGAQACMLVAADTYRCLPSDNKSLGQACNSDPNTWANLPCADGGMCLDYVAGEVCYALCKTTADCTAGKACAYVFTDWAGVGVCLTGCNILGGSCDAGTACYPSSSGANICMSSSGAARGAACNPGTPQTAPLPCGDGSVCRLTGPAATDGRCAHFCRASTDCGAGETCTLPVLQGISDLGACTAATPTVCTCDADYYCDTSCACDAECPCTCDTTTACDDSCECDIECKGGCGCTADSRGSALVLAPALLLWSSRRRRTR
ncbi:MAG: S1 family peptidase [Deltaproteobacteria bacterium]|nr:S1 family peptidase [Deltaproteobacteria bacterium]